MSNPVIIRGITKIPVLGKESGGIPCTGSWPHHKPGGCTVNGDNYGHVGNSYCTDSGGKYNCNYVIPTATPSTSLTSPPIFSPPLMAGTQAVMTSPYDPNSSTNPCYEKLYCQFLIEYISVDPTQLTLQDAQTYATFYLTNPVTVTNPAYPNGVLVNDYNTIIMPNVCINGATDPTTQAYCLTWKNTPINGGGGKLTTTDWIIIGIIIFVFIFIFILIIYYIIKASISSEPPSKKKKKKKPAHSY